MLIQSRVKRELLIDGMFFVTYYALWTDPSLQLSELLVLSLGHPFYRKSLRIYDYDVTTTSTSSVRLNFWSAASSLPLSSANLLT